MRARVQRFISSNCFQITWKKIFRPRQLLNDFRKEGYLRALERLQGFRLEVDNSQFHQQLEFRWPARFRELAKLRAL